MKPSERRALKAERQSSELKKADLKPQAEQISADDGKISDGCTDEGTGYKRKEGFFQSHIRLITFIITASLILTVFGPLGIDMIIRNQRGEIVDDKQDISLDAVLSIYDNRDRIQWGNLKNFNYADYSYDSKTGKYNVREYPVDGTRLTLKVGGSNMSNVPDYIYLMDYETEEYVNILKQDPREFIRNHKE